MVSESIKTVNLSMVNGFQTPCFPLNSGMEVFIEVMVSEIRGGFESSTADVAVELLVLIACSCDC